ncbi:MAG TPA: ABC transporter substrate-binding protein [Acidimicrobiales bacterium]|nr:ABC transporter substrate-binding protein [Acidimicrobiales bacterium]
MRGTRRGLRAAGALTVMSGLLLGIAGAATSAPAGATTEAPIVVGSICSCTGPEASSTSVSAPALQAWADEVNAKGGINGHKVDLILKDDTTNPGTSLAEAEQLVTTNHVVAIFDNSDVDNAWETYVTQHHIPVVGAFADSTPFYTNADFFTEGATLNWGNADTIFMMKKVNKTKLADLYCAEVPVCSQFLPAMEKEAPKHGVSVAYTAAIGFAAPNYTAQCLAAKAAGAQAMVVGDASSIVIKVASNCAAQGYEPVQLSGDGTVSNDWLTTPSMNGNIDYQPDIPFFVHNTPATETMDSAIKKYEPSLWTSPSFGEVVVENWASGQLLQAAATGHLTATPTTTDIYNGLYALHGTTLGGLAPPLTFHKGKPTANINCVFFMGIKNGQWTEPFGTGVSCPS